MLLIDARPFYESIPELYKPDSKFYNRENLKKILPSKDYDKIGQNFLDIIDLIKENIKIFSNYRSNKT